MKKKKRLTSKQICFFLVWAITALFVFSLASCNNHESLRIQSSSHSEVSNYTVLSISSNPTSETNSTQFTSITNTQTSIYHSYTVSASDSELAKIKKDFSTKINALDADKITKVELNTSDPEGNTYSYIDIRKENIKKWVELLKKMKVTAKPFDGVNGIGYGLTLYINESSQSMGGFMLPYIYETSQKVMLYLDNYAELKGDITMLIKSEGYPY